MTAALRPMTAADVEGVVDTAGAAFRGLERSAAQRVLGLERSAAQRVLGPEGREDEPPDRLAFFARRHEHLLRTDPDGQWVAVDEEGRVVGTACALRRGGLWGLSLLAVLPGYQSAGLGRRLLDHALGIADGASGGLILSSHDPRAIRRYALAGFALHPALSAKGLVRREALAWPEGVRAGEASDLAATAEVDVAVRGVPHGADLAVMLEDGGRLLVTEGGYVILRASRVLVLTATAAGIAADLLTAALLTTPEGQEAEVGFVTGGRSPSCSPPASRCARPVRSASAATSDPSRPTCRAAPSSKSAIAHGVRDRPDTFPNAHRVQSRPGLAGCI